MRFPEEYNKNMPWVTFSPWKYQMPKISTKPERLDKNRDGSSVTLYVPGDFDEQIQATWSLQDVIGGTNSGALGILQGEAQEFIASQAGPKITATYQAGSSSVSYPTDILVFEGIQPIQLNFKFNMIPINAEEAEEIAKICTYFKQKSLPVVDPSLGTGRLRFPSVWDINFRRVAGLGLEDTNKYIDMALVSVRVSFPSGGTSLLTFRDGYPVQTELSLSFQSTRKHRIG